MTFQLVKHKRAFCMNDLTSEEIYLFKDLLSEDFEGDYNKDDFFDPDLDEFHCEDIAVKYWKYISKKDKSDMENKYSNDINLIDICFYPGDNAYGNIYLKTENGYTLIFGNGDDGINIVPNIPSHLSFMTELLEPFANVRNKHLYSNDSGNN